MTGTVLGVMDANMSHATLPLTKDSGFDTDDVETKLF